MTLNSNQKNNRRPLFIFSGYINGRRLMTFRFLKPTTIVPIYNRPASSSLVPFASRSNRNQNRNRTKPSSSTGIPHLRRSSTTTSRRGPPSVTTIHRRPPPIVPVRVILLCTSSVVIQEKCREALQA
uniref:Uncharacterized protein n=1 Tax=Helianthus annuus TaxID=4232 RepID=A0A251UQM0_HELAN